MWGPAAVLPPRRTPSVLAGVGRFCFWRSAAAMRKDLGAIPRRGRSDSCPKLLPYEGPRESTPTSTYGLFSKGSVLSPTLAATLVQILQLGENGHRHIIMECNPRHGILTKALLKTGASVIALESDKSFIPHVKSLGGKLNGKLQVVHCDFFKMDPDNHNTVRPPVVLSQELFPSLGIKANSWSEDIPFKVVGIFPQKNEMKPLWKLLHDVYTCSSIYRYGRVQLCMFISESQYEKLIADPTNPNLYHVLSVLWQVSCEIKLLYKAPVAALDGHIKKRQPAAKCSSKHQNLCFIQITPRKTLFTEYLTPINYDIFFHMVKQCFGRRSAFLTHHLHSLTPYDPVTILNKAKIETNMKTCDMYPQGYKHLFETIERSSDNDSKWLYDRLLEDIVC
ncbi:dimethyladenosine transferase 2, mitochondrial isoform X1 [Heterocephalus glaber]|uniref:rRNA adenine N(6)-methyltransferase n=1 Tax=Heterocephalus glaber TaxID=10181 RepID=A0AAX6PJ13_HETGA|nr:dimethyladenosine transferase 2, mitochondrial isoform X1 [Heterocephalus glaber]